MTPGARLSAAIDVLADIEARRRPAADALKDWGLTHRFAGSGDRAAIGGLVFDALRRRQSAAWLMDEATPRAILFGALKLERGLGPDAIRRLADGGRFAPAPPTDAEVRGAELAAARRRPRSCARRLSGMARCQARRRVRRGPCRGGSGARPAGRRSTCASTRSRAIAPPPLRRSPISMRRRRRGRPSACASRSRRKRRARRSRRSPPSSTGWSRSRTRAPSLRRLLSGAGPRETVIDLCAGGGGKTLALAAQMENRGRLIATDSDIRRLAPIHARLARAGAVRCRGAHAARRRPPPLDDLAGAGRPRADRCALHRDRGVAAQSRRQMAGAARRAGAAHQGPGRSAGARRAAGAAGRAHRLHHLFAAGGGERRPCRAFLAAHPEFAIMPAGEMVRTLPGPRGGIRRCGSRHRARGC